MLLGGIVGLERQISGKPAGLRTNILICLGSALLMDLSLQLGIIDGGERIGDPARIAAQIVSGIGFIGAGTIMQARGAVIGLTTAATIWVVAAIGMTSAPATTSKAVRRGILVTPCSPGSAASSTGCCVPARGLGHDSPRRDALRGDRPDRSRSAHQHPVEEGDYDHPEGSTSR